MDLQPAADDIEENYGDDFEQPVKTNDSRNNNAYDDEYD
jgi:hypothetical protein